MLQEAGCAQAVMAGQVKHAKLFANITPDWTLMQVLMRLRAKSTDALISAIADVMRGKGIELLDSTAFLQPLLARDGHIAGPAPDDAAQGRPGLRLSDG